MKLTKIALTLLVAAAVATPALRASAAGTENDSGPYITLDGGVNFMQDATLKINNVKQADKYKFDAGFRVDLAAGYNLNKWVGVELETGFLYNSHRAANANPNDSDAKLYTVPLLVNVVFRYENESKFVPYVGAGAGAAVTFVDVAGTTGYNGFVDANIVFAYQGLAGVAYKISDKMAVDVGYKFLGTSEQHYSATFGNSYKLSDIGNHYIGVSLTWKF